MSEAVDPGVPPLLDSPPPPPPRAKWRWAVHLFLLAGYVLGLGLVAANTRAPGAGNAALPNDVQGLLIFCGWELAMFGLFFLLAWLFSRASADSLYLKWRGGIMPVLWGALFSVLLRVGIAIALLVVLIPFAAMRGEKKMEKDMEAFRPKIETLVEPRTLMDPLYLTVMVTGVSFVVAGFREELWRAGMLAGLAGLIPSVFASRKGQYLAVLIAALIFGIGHAPQGIGGVALTGVLGLGLGAIMVWRKSLWEAALAHGFFDASSFVALYLILKYAPPSILKAFGVS